MLRIIMTFAIIAYAFHIPNCMGGDFEIKMALYHDTVRGRKIPVAIYAPKWPEGKTGVVLFSHGYGGNRGGDYLYYSYLTEGLAENGYFVASIQHELPQDEALAMTGDLRITRMPNWERGARNIEYVLAGLKREYPQLDFTNTTVMGHSNGGDMSALFAERRPDLVTRLVTLDHRRYPLPRNRGIGIVSLRGADYPADEGVLPTPEEAREFNIDIISFTDINHGDMDDKGSEEQKNPDPYPVAYGAVGWLKPR